jgi:hypothetical protein
VSRSAHILWPAAIISLLLMSVLATVVIMLASQSDGGAKIVDQYYQKSVAWDSMAAIQSGSDQLGWTAAVVVRNTDGAGREGFLSIINRDGLPVDSISGSVSVRRPHSTRLFGTHSIDEVADSHGQYRFDFPYSAHGLWDIELRASRSGSQFVQTFRVEI